MPLSALALHVFALPFRKLPLIPLVCRVVLMGQGGVGKTAMVLRYTTGDFNEKVCAQAIKA